jgi:hypothetical protein
MQSIPVEKHCFGLVGYKFLVFEYIQLIKSFVEVKLFYMSVC